MEGNCSSQAWQVCRQPDHARLGTLLPPTTIFSCAFSLPATPEYDRRLRNEAIDTKKVAFSNRPVSGA